MDQDEYFLSSIIRTIRGREQLFWGGDQFPIPTRYKISVWDTLNFRPGGIQKRFINNIASYSSVKLNRFYASDNKLLSVIHSFSIVSLN